MSTKKAHGRWQVLAVLLSVMFSLGLPLAPTSPVSTPVYAHNDSDDKTLPNCGNEGEDVCWAAAHSGNSSATGDWAAGAIYGMGWSCDRGLKPDGGLASSNCVDDSLPTNNRHAYDDKNDTWLLEALRQQRNNIARDEPVNWITTLMTHNAFNNRLQGYTFPNQYYSISDQLKAGSRALELDIHWAGNNVRLCHSSQRTATGSVNEFCAPLDRLYSQGIKEIRNWLNKQEDEIIVIFLDDNIAGHSEWDSYVVNPLVEWLGDKLLRRSEKPQGRWPTRAEMLALGRHVIVFGGAGDAHGSDFIFDFRWDSQYAYADVSKPGEFDPATCKAGKTDTYSGTDLVVADERWSRIYEDRAVIVQGGQGTFDETDTRQFANCHVSLIGFDQFNYVGDPDRRRHATVWSWQDGDSGQNGGRAMYNPVVQRWVSRSSAERHHFACAKPRDLEVNPNDWADKLGATWRVTLAVGTGAEGGAICEREYGLNGTVEKLGLVYAVPTNGWQNEQLKAALETASERKDFALTSFGVWLNYLRKPANTAYWLNHRPTVKGSAPYRLLYEGEAIPFAVQSSDPDGDSLTYTWDFGDGATGTGAAPSHVYADNGVYYVTVTADDSYGGIRSHTFQLTVENVAPTVDAGVNQTIDEAGTVSLAPATFSDPGFDCPGCTSATEENFTATIDWGEGTVTAGAVSETPGSAGVVTTGTTAGSHTYGDNGTYTVTVCVTDDDGAKTCDTLTVTVNNLNTAATIDKSAAITFLGGDDAFLGRRGVEQSFSAKGDDPGSDDLIFTWSFPPSTIGATTIYYNNGASADPAQSPGPTFPFSATGPNKSTFNMPGFYNAIVDVTDDDGGTDRDQLPLLMTDSRTCTKVQAFWWQQYGPYGPQVIDDGRLQGYLDVIRFASKVFDDSNLKTLADAEALLNPAVDPGPAGLARQNALAAWLNFASGGVRWDQTVPRLNQSFFQVMAGIEATLLKTNASTQENNTAFRAAEFINTISPNDAACNDAGTP